MPAVALANSIVVGNHNLQPNQAGQVVSLIMTGTDAYKNSDLGLLINGGVAGAPVVTHVFGATAGAIPIANLAGSIWENGQAGVGGTFPDGTASVGTGFRTIAGFETVGQSSSTASGIYVTLTFSTIGVAPGVYSFSLTDHPGFETALFFGVDPETFDPISVPLDILNGTLTVVPEPTSMMLGAIGMFGISIYVWRRKR